MPRRLIFTASALGLSGAPAVACAQSSSSGDSGALALLTLIPLGMAGFFMCVWGFFILVAIGSIVMWVTMLVDVAQRQPWEFPQATQDSKLLWLLIVILGGGIGATVYFFLVYRKVRRMKAPAPGAPAPGAPVHAQQQDAPAYRPPVSPPPDETLAPEDPTQGNNAEDAAVG